ncbi:hypothetical protein [Niallia endozanthoxylica]|uniref:Uncharacterized protein n=1 Tax=Niallia endozanthoxylica TaxID=2036016 RepID=A0A5J5HTF0_9BACI|nr:hypothetical protein [Niallia endozanthoxylica]KAA9024235.1 hypothetical protein F4V44_11570 [Niallia endozanthoxylica]
MNQVVTDLHNKRYEWAFHAKKEFLNHFVRLDVQKIEHYHHPREISVNTVVDKESFQSLMNCLELAEKVRKQENEIHEKELEKLEQIIFEKKAQMDLELNFFHMKNHEFSSKIENYKEFSNDIKTIIQEMKRMDKDSFVKNFLKYDANHKKASILNRNAIQLQITVEKKIENQLMEIKERTNSLNLLKIVHLELPKLDPIPKIKQKIDSYWLKSRYDKAFNRLSDEATVWLEEMYQAYQNVLQAYLNEASDIYNRLAHEAEVLKRTKEETISQLQNELTEIEEKRDYLRTEYEKADEMWERDCDHARQLQGYFIKHWLLYKKELQHKFLSENPQERWIAAQYLQLLQQDGENIIESMNI